MFSTLLICPSIEVLSSLNSSALPDCYVLHVLETSRFNTHPLTITEEVDFCDIAEQAIAKAKRVQAQAILYMSDFSALIAAVVCETLNLPGPKLASVVMAYCKPLARQYDPAQSIPIHVLDADVLNCPSSINFPVFIKPICGSASQFSGIATNELELRLRCDEVATYYSKIWQKFAQFFKVCCSDIFPQEWLSMQAPVIVEPFLPGTIINCDGYIQHGIVKILGLVEDSHTEIEQRYFVPVFLSTQVQQSVIDYAAQHCRAIGLDNSCFCIEYMVEGETVHLLEFNPRIASCFRSLYRQCFEIDLFQVAAQLALGKDIVIPDQVPKPSPLFFVNLYLKHPGYSVCSEEIIDFDMVDHVNRVTPFEVVPAVQPGRPIHSLFAYANVWGKSQQFTDYWSNRLATLIARPSRMINNQSYDISVFYESVEAVEGIVNYPDWIAWVDYQQCQLYEYDKDAARLIVTSLPFLAYTVAYHQTGHILFGGPMGLVISTAAWLPLGDRSEQHATQLQNTDFRQLWQSPINTIRADFCGRLYATEETLPSKQAGRLVKFELDGSTQVIDTELSYGNTIDFSPDGHQLYLADTTQRSIIQYDLDDDGNPINHCLFAVFSLDDGAPDGLVVDATGNVWITSWFGGKVKGYDSQGHWLGDLLIPVQNVTSICPFQGNFLVTTSSQTWHEGNPWMSDFFIPPTIPTSPIYSVGIQDQPIQEKSACFVQIKA